jgi:hypothetical protein
MMNNLQKVIAVIIAFTVISGALLVIIPSAGQSAEAKSLAVPDQIAVYVDPAFRDRGMTDLVRPDISLDLAPESMLVNNTPVGTTQPFVTSATFWDETGAPFTDVLNATWYDAYNVINMTKRGEGEHCELWVADNLTFYDPLDPRNSMVAIEDWMVNYMVEEFDTNIYPTMTETFIDAPQLNGSSPDVSVWQYLFDDTNLTEDNLTADGWLYTTNDTGKIMIMVFNMIDENWYDPVHYTSYTAGYYWSFIRNLYDRNVMHIDCYDWLDRIGSNVSRPYVYESTFAHEYQHLLHDEQDPDEDTWVNEGLSMASEFLCGYGIDMMYVTYYYYWPDNSLTVWGDLPGDLILGDYGAVLLFMLYLYDHYGGKPMLQSVFFNELNGIESIDDALLDMGHNRMSFDKVFRDWRLANLLLDSSFVGGLYGYKTFDRYDLYDPWGYEGPWYMEVSADDSWPIYHSEFGTTQYMQAYGVDYVLFYDVYGDGSGLKFMFDGDDYVHAGWQFVENPAPLNGIGFNSWWNSNNGDLINNLLTFEANLSGSSDGEHLLTVTSCWDIEEAWDFGFVQVSTDGGETWTSLDDVEDYCTEESHPDAMESIAANLPGITGVQEEWTEMTFDLSAYDGMEVLVGFRYMTDWASSYGGWNIAEVALDGEQVDLASMSTDVPPETDFIVTLMAYNTVGGFMIMDVPTLDLDETATKLFSTGEFMYIMAIVSPTMGPVDYCVDVDYRDMGMLR